MIENWEYSPELALREVQETYFYYLVMEEVKRRFASEKLQAATDQLDGALAMILLEVCNDIMMSEPDTYDEARTESFSVSYISPELVLAVLYTGAPAVLAKLMPEFGIPEIRSLIGMMRTVVLSLLLESEEDLMRSVGIIGEIG